MFRKVHYRLTFLCAGITILILLILSLVSLSVSESGLKKSQFLSFQKDVGTLTYSLKQQTVITHEWLSGTEKRYSYQLLILDNNIPLLYNKIHTPDGQQAFQDALHYYDSHYKVEFTDSEYSKEPRHTEYEFTSSDNRKYYAGLAVIPEKTGEIRMLVLSPLNRLYAQIWEQRFLFLCIDIVAAVFLFLFSWLFTKKLLLPVEKSRLQQIQFVASASHELRTPLAVILSCANACDGSSPEEQRGFLSSIHSEGQRMSRLIDDMLFLSQADTHSFDIHIEPFEPDTLLLNTYEAFTALAKEKNIHLSIRLPDSPVPALGGDRQRLSQVLAILLHNAVCYTPAGGTVVLSLFLTKKLPGSCIFSVADNGPGIPDSEKENIFRRFYRTDKARSAKGHFGLGLCIAAEIITAMKGSIQVKDTPGGGSTFLISIPMQHPIPS